MPSPTGPFSVPSVILITHEFQPFHGGVATYCAELARNIHALGTPIEVWAPDYGQKYQTEIQGFPVVRLPGPGNLRPTGLFRLAKAIWARRHQLQGHTLLLPSVGAQMSVMLIALLPGWPQVPTAVLWHGSEILRFQRNPFWKFLAFRLFRKSDFFFAASPFTQNLAQQRLLASLNRKVNLIPCAPGSDAFLAPEILPPDAEGRIRILTLARLHPRKGQLHTVRALENLPPLLKSKIVYQIAGEGDSGYLKELEQTCAQAGIPFEYLGPVPPARLSSVYGQCDIYAMTSRNLPRSVEGFGITYLEAGLQSKPVVACRSGGVDGAVLDQKTGLLVDENDLPALTAAFAALISDPELRRRLGEGNFRHASAFSWGHSAKLMLGFLSAPGSSA